MKSRFSKQSDLYATYRPDYPQELYEFILSHLQTKKTAWDCATGSGQVATVLADHFEQVYASDISREQMEHAPQKSNIRYFNTPAEDTGFQPDMFDLITVAQAIHWFNIDAFYKEVARTAKEDALLAVIGYGMVHIDEETDQFLERFYDDMFGRYFMENRKLLDEQYQTIPFPFKEIPSKNFEKKIRWQFSDLKGFLNSWSPVQQYKNDHGTNPVNSFLKSIKSLWKPGKSRTVTFPVFLRLGRL